MLQPASAEMRFALYPFDQACVPYAGRGNLVLLEALCNAAEKSRGKPQLQNLLNSGAARGDSALLSACSFGYALVPR